MFIVSLDKMSEQNKQKLTKPQQDRERNAELQARFRSEAILFEHGALTSVGVKAYAGSLAEILSSISSSDRQRVLRTYAAKISLSFKNLKNFN